MPLPFELLAPGSWRATLQYGDNGEDVASWQAALVLSGLNPGKVDGAFGRRTHNATLSWQFRRGMEANGRVSAGERAALIHPHRAPLLDVGGEETMRIVLAKNWSRNVGPQPKRWIVLHSMEAPEASSTARNCAEWFAGRRGPAPRASAHYCVDAREVIQCVPEDRIAWAAPGANRWGIHIELAGFSRQTLDEWLDEYSSAMLRRAALLTARRCRDFGIPIEFAHWDDLRAGEAGITTHEQVTRAWPEKNTHTDPGGAFPMGDFLAMVRASTEAL